MASKSKEKGVKAAQLDLAQFIEDQTTELEREKTQLEQSRLGAVAGEQQNQGKLLVNSFLSKISNPAQYIAAVNAYGGLY